MIYKNYFLIEGKKDDPIYVNQTGNEVWNLIC